VLGVGYQLLQAWLKGSGTSDAVPSEPVGA